MVGRFKRIPTKGPTSGRLSEICPRAPLGEIPKMAPRLNRVAWGPHDSPPESDSYFGGGGGNGFPLGAIPQNGSPP